MNHAADGSSTSNILLSRSLHFRSFKRKATSKSAGLCSATSRIRDSREMTSRRTIEALSHCRISISVTPGQRALYSAIGYSFGGRTTRSAPLSCYESGKIRFVMWRRSITDCKLNTPHLRLAIHLSSPSGRLLTSTHQCYSSP